MKQLEKLIFISLIIILIPQSYQFLNTKKQPKPADAFEVKSKFEVLKEKLQNQVKSQPLCIVCHETFTIILEYVSQQKNLDLVEQIATYVCVNTKMYDEEVCTSMIKFQGGVMYSQIVQHFLDPEISCAYLKACDQPRLVIENITEWSQQVLKDKPSKTMPIAQDNKVKFALLADIHVDLFYEEGSEADCGEPVCCRNKPSEIKQPASKYGEHSCDTPLSTVDATIAHLAQNHPDIDFVFLLGDYASSCSWCKTYKYEVQNALPTILGVFKKYFKGKALKIYSILGNHEAVPVDNIDFEDESNNAYVYHSNGQAMAE